MCAEARAIAALASLADGMLPAGQGLDSKAPVDTSTSVVEGMRGKAWKYDKALSKPAARAPEKVAARETPAGAAAACEAGPAPESSAGTPREDVPTGRARIEGDGEGDDEGDVDEHGDEDDLIADFLLDVVSSSDDSD